MGIISRVSVLGPVELLLTTFLLGFTTLLLLFWYSSRKQTYWKKLGVPYVEPVPFLGNILANFKKPPNEIEVERYKKYGRIYGHYEGNRPIISVGEPEVLRSIMVKDFQAFPGRRRNIPVGDEISGKTLFSLQGEDWKRIRSIVTPTFTTGKIKRVLSIFKECSKTLVKNFRESAEKGEPIEAKSIYGAFTMDVIASSAFSTKIDSHNDPNNEFVKTAREVFTLKISWRAVLMLLLPRVMRYFRIGVFPPEGMKFFTDVTLQIMEERKRTGQTRNDFLQLLMDTAKEVSEEDKLEISEKDGDIADNYGETGNLVYKTITSKKSLSFEEMVAQCIIFFLAGYDTTSSTLAFSTYLLALNPDVQEKLIQELDDILSENNGELTYEAVQSMKYLDNVISETLRLYPPLIRLERVADENYKLGNFGITIPEGMIVTIPVYAIQRDPKHFPDPEKFDPNRWLPEERAKRDPYTYMPFGAGPRNCVGMRFALMEVKVCLAYVLSNFRIQKSSKTKVPLDFYKGLALLKPKEINILFEVRTDAVKAL